MADRPATEASWLPEHIRRVVDTAPRPTSAQRSRLWQLIAPRPEPAAEQLPAA